MEVFADSVKVISPPDLSLQYSLGFICWYSDRLKCKV